MLPSLTLSIQFNALLTDVAKITELQGYQETAPSKQGLRIDSVCSGVKRKTPPAGAQNQGLI
jgi:hypothetical protein